MRPYFLPKTAENSGFSNTFEKSTASALAENRAEGGAFLHFRTTKWAMLSCVRVGYRQTVRAKNLSDKGYRQTMELPYFCVAIVKLPRFEML